MSRSLSRATDPVRVVLWVGLFGICVLALAYFFLDGLADRSTSQRTRGEVSASVHPVLSVRRAPTTLSMTSRTGSVRRALNNVINRLPSGACLRVDWMGQTLASVKTDVPFIPASTSKIVTAAVALEVLGPTYSFETQIFSDPISATGSVSNIYVVGGGDPLLVRSDYPSTEKYPTINGTPIESLVNAVSSAGIKQITQSITVVDSRYDEKRFLDIWPSSFFGVEAGPLGALMFNDSTILGQPNRADDPGIGAGNELNLLLSQQGIVVPNSVQRTSAVPSAATKIGSVTSAPLSAVVQEMLVNSDNNTSELLLKELGYVKKGSGSTQNGLDVVSETIQQWNYSPAPTVVDGSGLSSSNSMTCDFLSLVLEKNADAMPGFMAVAGNSGTLINQFENSDVDGRLVAKTGTLTGVKSLVGYLPLDEEDDVRFSFLMNSSGIDNPNSFRPIWNSFADALSRARSSPRPEELLP